MKKLIKMILLTSMLFCFSSIEWVDAMPSDWAKQGVDDMKNNNLVKEDLVDDAKFQDMVTREEFAELAVLLYAKAKEVSVNELMAKNLEEPFLDTDNPYVAVAFNEGIVNGTSKVTFNPRDKITREAIATMIRRELNELGKDTTVKKEADFKDMNQVSNWAKEGLNYASQEGIINGVGNNLVSPKQNTTREQAIIMMSRIAKNNGWMDDIHKPTEPINKPVSSDEYTYQAGFAIPKDSDMVYVNIVGPNKSCYLIGSVICDMPDVAKQKELLIGFLDSNPKMINQSGKDYILKQFKDLYLEHPTKKDLHGWSSPESDPNNDCPMMYYHDMGNGYSVRLGGRNDLYFEIIKN